MTENTGGRVRAAGAMGRDVLDLSQVRKDFQQYPQLGANCKIVNLIQ